MPSGVPARTARPLKAGARAILLLALLHAQHVSSSNDTCWIDSTHHSPFTPGTSDFEKYIDRIRRGPGVWKWRQYFNVYEKHFAHFRGAEVHLLEIGIYSGGSLAMWRNYFGERLHLYGVDLSERTLVYDGVARYGSPKIYVGNQADQNFWSRFKQEVPRLDIVVEDGSHSAPDQQVSSHLLCEGVFTL